MNKIIAVFDVGKTNKKIVLFDQNMKIVYQEEENFPEVVDEDGFARDDVESFLHWMNSTLFKLIEHEKYNITALNFSTYGATLVFMKENGELAVPVYNYLKPMPENTLKGFYEKYGGVDEFSRNTASPALDMLNSGLQNLYVKKNKGESWRYVEHIVHFPQYLSYLYTNKIVSEHTSIGCHTALWDFDNMKYHAWLNDEGISLPEPISNSTTFQCKVFGKDMRVGIGIHDSSASLVPYLKVAGDTKFLLVSSGTWAINMNPFSKDQLTAEELKQDCLCYLSVDQQQVKASRLFMGHIHEVNTKLLSGYFNKPENEFKKVMLDKEKLKSIVSKAEDVFFPNSEPSDYKLDESKLSLFNSYEGAYHQFMYELTKIESECIKRALDKNDNIQHLYISGGFVKNEIFTCLLATFFSEKEVYTAEIHNATALGAAMVVADAFNFKNIEMEMGKCVPLN